MRVSEGNLTQQYYCDYLTTLVGEIISGSADEPVCRGVHESIAFRNLFLHRMSVDGGFHARVLSAILHQPDDSRVLMELLAGSETSDRDALPVEGWLKREYASAVADANLARQIAASALLRSYISVPRIRPRRSSPRSGIFVRRAGGNLRPAVLPLPRYTTQTCTLALAAGRSGMSSPSTCTPPRSPDPRLFLPGKYMTASSASQVHGSPP